MSSISAGSRRARACGRCFFSIRTGRASSSISPRTNRPKPEEPNLMVRAVLDHLVVAAATLEQGEDYVETRLGARPLRGGRHVAMGTHNSLLKLGEKTYLEVIAIDPDGIAPGRARWFGLDTAALRAEVHEAPRLIHLVARTDGICAARARHPRFLARWIRTRGPHRRVRRVRLGHTLGGADPASQGIRIIDNARRVAEAAP